MAKPSTHMFVAQLRSVGAAVALAAMASQAQAQTATTTTTTSPSTSTATPAPTSSVTGAYDRLSPGNKRVADALFDGQAIPPTGGEAWSLDKIAASHQDGRGWGEVFKDMKAQGLTDAKNLGELVSGRSQAHMNSTTGTGSSAVTVTTASGRSETVRSGGRERERETREGLARSGKPSHDSDAVKGITTGRGDGTMHGHVSAGTSSGTDAGRNTAIVTARGSSATAGSNAGSSAGGGRSKSTKND